MRIEPEEAAPWGYGFAWRNWDSYRITVLPIPFNILARWFRDFYFFLAKYSDNREDIANRKGYYEGFDAGKKEGYKQGKADAARELGRAILEGMSPQSPTCKSEGKHTAHERLSK